MIGAAQYAEDICVDDLSDRAGYGASRATADVWPPSYECTLLGNDVEPVVVQHRDVALVRFGAIAVFPIAYAAAALGIVFGLGRRATRTPHAR